MKKLLFLVAMLITTTVVSYAQKTEKTYLPVYVLNTETAQKLAKEQQLNQQTYSVRIFMLEYPVLDNLNDYNPKEKYSLINKKFVVSTETSKNEKWTYYTLVNSQVYKVKNKNRTNRSL